MITVLQLARLPNIKVPAWILYLYNQFVMYMKTALIVSYG